MPVIPGGRIQGIPIQDCLLLSVILNHLEYFSFSMLLSVRLSSVTYPDVPAVCVVRVVFRSLWCSAPVDIPTFSVECGGELEKIDFLQGRYSSGDCVVDLDCTVPDRL